MLGNAILSVILFLWLAPDSFSFVGFMSSTLYLGTSFPPSRWLRLFPLAGLLGLAAGLAIHHFPFTGRNGKTSPEASASQPKSGTVVVRLRPFLGWYTLYTILSGVIFVLLVATTFDQEVSLFPVSFFEIIGPAWIQVVVALGAWIVKGLKGVKEVTLPLRGLVQPSLDYSGAAGWLHPALLTFLDQPGFVVQFRLPSYRHRDRCQVSVLRFQHNARRLRV